jgi:lipid II:glycine glycyltransferase (peptidoglycan interpeptide bridge formation enzyme)
VESEPSRALPAHRLLSAVRLGEPSGGLDASALDAGIAAVAALARRERSILRVTVQTFTLDAESRAHTSEALRRHGFRSVATTRSYERTLVLDLRPDENALLAGFHYNARRRIRNVAKFPVRVTTAGSVSLAPRLQELAEETHFRTGGESQQIDWASHIRMSAEAPHLSRIAILERTDRGGPDAVLAFAWGCMHGRVAEYSESGSTRPDDMKVSTSYALMWDLIAWARRSGAEIFDLGGVTQGAANSDDPLGGISDFKRFFSERELEVGQQWLLEPHPARAVAARVVSRGAGLIRAAASSIRSRKR